MQYQLKRTTDLTIEEISAWKGFQAGNPGLASPYFHLEFTKAVSAVRTDVEIAVIHQAGKPVAFFPFQRGTLNIGKPVGGKLSDYHGIISAPDTSVDVQELLRQCGLAGWDFDHLPVEQQSFANSIQCVSRSAQIETCGSLSEYERKRKEDGSDVVSKIKQRMRKTEREFGPLELIADDQDPAVFEQLLAWKSAQYLRTGLADVFAFPWTKQLLCELKERTTSDFGVVTTTLRSRGRVISTLLGLRQGGLVHGWFTAYDLELSDLSPGLLHYLKWIEAAPDLGIEKFDLGKGDEAYKWRFATTCAEVGEGSVTRNSLGIWLRNGWRATKRLLEKTPGGKSGQGPLSVLKPLRSWLQFH